MQIVLDLYDRLIKGDVIRVKEVERDYGKDRKTVLRYFKDIEGYLKTQLMERPLEVQDIAESIFDKDMFNDSKYDFWLDLRSEEFTEYVEEHGPLFYDKKEDSYELIWPQHMALTPSEYLCICKILLESRSMVREEMEPIIKKLLINSIKTSEQKNVINMIKNELHHYIEPTHGEKFIELMWNLEEAILQHRFIKVLYQAAYRNAAREYTVMPVGLMFSEYYFYLIIYRTKEEDGKTIQDGDYPHCFRIDRIQEAELLDRTFRLPYREKFSEGEFRRRVQFMSPGPLQVFRFKFEGNSVEHILDRFPDAIHEDLGNGQHRFEISVYGDRGMKMWMATQGEQIKLEE